MVDKLIQIHVYHWGNCRCAEFLAPITSWKDVADRHELDDIIRKDLVKISDIEEDWMVDLYQCQDCGRYWAQESAGSPWITRSYPFLYWADIPPDKDPAIWLSEQRRNAILNSLKKNKDADYETRIAPKLILGTNEWLIPHPRKKKR
jgi:hypothetical protein